MNPIDFVVNCHLRTPVYEIAEAMMQDIKIIGGDVDFVVHKYYYDEEEKRMVLAIRGNDAVDS